jgi:hypothetical protein
VTSARHRGVAIVVVGVAWWVAGCGDSTTEPTPPATTDLPIAPPAALRDCVTSTSSAGALLEVCLPDLWNGEVIAWAHGYTNPGPDRPPYTALRLPSDDIGGSAVKDIVKGIGNPAAGYYGYASTSYRRNGLVAAEGAEDLRDLAVYLRQRVAGLAGDLELPVVSYLIGASEGGLSTVLALEEESGSAGFDGGMALCGPIGDFRGQLDHMGDFRAVFDYFFSGVLPGDATGIPTPEQTVTDARWDALREEIRAALAADPSGANQLFQVTGAAVDDADPGSPGDAAVDLLRYSFFGTNDARTVLGGNPFDNQARVYSGSLNDEALNVGVDRFGADPAALAVVEARYETSGRLLVPLVVMHTGRDPIVPSWHRTLYEARVTGVGSGPLLRTIESEQYGHCQFTLPELVGGFAGLVLAVTARNLATSSALFAGEAEQSEFLTLARRLGASPSIVEARR